MSNERFRNQVDQFLQANSLNDEQYESLFVLSYMHQWTIAERELHHKVFNLIATNYVPLRGGALSELVYRNRLWDKSKNVEKEKLAVDALRARREAAPEDSFNLYTIGWAYSKGFDFLEFDESFSAIIRSEEISRHPIAKTLWDIIKRDPGKISEEQRIFYLKKLLDEKPKEIPWNFFQEDNILKSFVETPRLWINNLEPYASDNFIIREFLKSLRIVNGDFKDILSYYYNKINSEHRDDFDLLLIATIEDCLNIRPFVNSLVENVEKIPSYRPFVYFVVDRLHDNIFEEEWSKHARCEQEESDVELVREFLVKYIDDDDGGIKFFDYQKQWCSICIKNKKLFAIYKEKTILIMKALADEEGIEKFQFFPFKDPVSDKFHDYSRKVTRLFAFNFESIEDLLKSFLFIFGHADFAKVMFYELRHLLNSEIDKCPSLDVIRELIKKSPWYKRTNIKDTLLEGISDIDVLFSTISEPESCKTIGKHLSKETTTKEIAIEYFKRGALSGSCDCMNLLGYAYYYGEGVQKNLPLSLHWFTLAWQAGNAVAAFNLGLLFRDELHDDLAAFPFFERALNIKNQGAKFAYAKALFDGLGCEKKPNEALLIFKELIKKKYDPAIKFIKSRRLEQILNVTGDSLTNSSKDHHFKADGLPTIYKRFICLDTETTGLSSYTDRVCEIAAVEFDPNTFKVVSRFHVYINPQREMPYKAFKIHGLSNEFLNKMPLFGSIVHDFISYINGAEIYIHNASYDTKMLNAEFRRIGLKDFEHYCNGIHCTLRAAQKLRGLGENRLDNLCDDFGIDRTKRDLHGALIDCELLIQVIRAMQLRGAHLL